MGNVQVRIDAMAIVREMLYMDRVEELQQIARTVLRQEATARKLSSN